VSGPQWLASLKISPKQQEVVDALHEVHRISEVSLYAGSFYKYLSPAQDIRTKMREMGDLSQVPIEPKEQTALLDACVSQAGVIGGGVPGGET
jgi:phosphomevalonate kinase